MAKSTNHNQSRGRMAIRHTSDEIRRLESVIMAEVERCGFPRSAQFAIRLSLEEAVTNAFSHGHRDLGPDEAVSVEYEVGPDSVWIAVEDRGPGFSPGVVPDPTLDENLSKPTGRGLMLIRAYMTEVTHNERGNRLMMRFERPSER